MPTPFSWASGSVLARGTGWARVTGCGSGRGSGATKAGGAGVGAGAAAIYFSGMTFTSLKLSVPLLRAVVEKGYATPTPIQAAAIQIGRAHV